MKFNKVVNDLYNHPTASVLEDYVILSHFH
jgi:hypothetical protein